MIAPNRFEKAIWAVDVFAEIDTTHHVVPTLLGLQKGGMATLEACAVLGPREISQKENALAKLKGLLQTFRDDAEIIAKVLESPKDSTSSAVETLLAHAKKAGADILAASTHARKGLDRFFLGSFVETLLLKSPFPILTVNPKADSIPFLDHVFIPTDFSPGSEMALDIALDLSKRTGARLSLFHGIRDPRVMHLHPPGLIAFEMLEKSQQEGAAAMERWIEKIESVGAHASSKISLVEGNMANAILEAAEQEHANLILLSGHHPVGGILGVGGTSRQLIRTAKCPVLAIPVKGL